MLLQLMMLKHFFFVLLCGFALLTDAQDQAGFISIDCGLQGIDNGYTENSTGLNYVSDERFIDTGESKQILKQFKGFHQQQYWSLRIFPEGDRHCYKINVIKGTKYLIRAAFLYGNYDEQDMPQTFSLYLGTDLWDSVNLTDSSAPVVKEIIHVPLKTYVHVCLAKTSQRVPFISAIELRPLDNEAYGTKVGSLALYGRYDTGSSHDCR
ncbi:hypothetical protein UlMin_018571 [Ulmus minor]